MKSLLPISILALIICGISLLFPYCSYLPFKGSSGERIIDYGNDRIEITSLPLLGMLIITLISCIKKMRSTSIVAFILCLPLAFLYFIISFSFTFFQRDPEMEFGYFIAMLAAIAFIISHFINIFVVFRKHEPRPSDLLIDDDLLE